MQKCVNGDVREHEHRLGWPFPETQNPLLIAILDDGLCHLNGVACPSASCSTLFELTRQCLGVVGAQTVLLLELQRLRLHRGVARRGVAWCGVAWRGASAAQRSVA